MEALIAEASAAFGPDGDPALAGILTAALWLAGACAASFSGLVATRLGSVPEGASLLTAISRPPSSCDACARRIPPLGLVPVFGWLVSGGRCGPCGARVPAAYPVSEAVAGAATAVTPWLWGGFGPEAAWTIFFLWAAVLAAWIDAVEHVIPEEITWTLLFSGLLASPFGLDLLDRAGGAATCAAAMYAALAVTGWLKGLDTRAGGDVAMAAAAGAWVGLASAPAFLLASSLAYVAYAGPARMGGAVWVPMGPALAAGALAAAAASAAGILPTAG